MENQDIINGSKLIANYLGWVYIPFNELNGFLRPGWYCPAPNSKKIFTPKQGYPEQVGNIWYKYICRNHVDLRFYNSFDSLMPVIQKVENDWSLQKLRYSWESGSHTYYNFDGFEFNLYKNGAYSEINLSLDPPMEISKSFDKKLTWVQNTFKVVVETIKYINEKNI